MCDHRLSFDQRVDKPQADETDLRDDLLLLPWLGLTATASHPRQVILTVDSLSPPSRPLLRFTTANTANVVPNSIGSDLF
ncbi:MAG: hypothetical protein DWH80_01315 [Planctomycetota bacterium]|nr:MAG: hypothetical protein DWH80_01315 [Planctomycetota bacterium]